MAAAGTPCWRWAGSPLHRVLRSLGREHADHGSRQIHPEGQRPGTELSPRHERAFGGRVTLGEIDEETQAW